MAWKVDADVAGGFLELSHPSPTLRLTPSEAAELAGVLIAQAALLGRRRQIYLLKKGRLERDPLPDDDPPGQAPPS